MHAFGAVLTSNVLGSVLGIIDVREPHKTELYNHHKLTHNQITSNSSADSIACSGYGQRIPPTKGQ